MERVMGWVPEERVCTHASRPEPRWSDAGRVWECESCGARFTVEGVDYGHDVMLGEASVGARWKPQRESRNA